MIKNDYSKSLAVIIIILIITQIGIFYFYYNQIQIIKLGLNESNNNINVIKQNLQEEINDLTSSLNSLSTKQIGLQNQIASLKAETSADFSDIIEQEIRGVVTIKTNVAQGTGFLIDDEGYIITNAHVLSSAKYANAYTYDGKKYSASLIGYDNNIDLALLKISGNFDSLDFGNSDNVKIGEKVIAIGNPLGLSFSVTEGIISARDRVGINKLNSYFQTDAAINPGNSGGPLINTYGKVIGINNFKMSGGENLGFALESNYIIETINNIALEKINSTLV